MTETNERNHLLRLRRRAAKLGDIGYRIEKVRGGYLLIEPISKVSHSPYSGGDPIKLAEIESELMKLEGMKQTTANT